MSKIASTSLASGSEGLVCFVCDIGVVGRYYTLASCRTQATKIRLIEKLGQLVGDDYMVVVSEDDIICRGCATMINSLDRLEKELTSLRSMVLRYLEKKYDLDEGELVSTRANVSPKDMRTESQKNEFLDFQARKRKAMCGEVENEDLKDTKDSMWLQCDRCKYTTHQNPNNPPPPPRVTQTKPVEKTQPAVHQGVPHHQQVVQRVVQPDIQQPMIIQQIQPPEKQNGGKPPSVIRVDSFGDDTSDPLANVGRMEHIVEVKKDTTDVLEDAETVEMITGDIVPDFHDDSMATVETGQMLQMDGGKQVTLQSVEGEDGNNTLCMVDENGMIVQRVEQAEDGTLYVQMPDSSDPTKQMLSVAEDGSVQMVEVLWGDDMVQPDDSETRGIVNF